jgi:hypothetical protein
MGKHLGPATQTGFDFNKICVFCGKYCVRINKCVFIILKIKCVNSGRIDDICNKVNFITKLHTFYNTLQTFCQNTQHFIKTHTNITIFDTFGKTISLRDLRISQS